MILGGWLFRENSRLRSEISQTQTNRDEFSRRESELAGREKLLLDKLSNKQTSNSETEKQLAKVREEREKLAQELKNQKGAKPQIVEKRENVQPKPTNSPGRQLTVASFVLAPSLRETNDLPTLSIAPKTDTAAMQVEVEGDVFALYKVRLQSLTDGKLLWQSGKIKSRKLGANRALNVSFPAKLLKSQIYTLEVSGVSAAGAEEILSNYSFRIVR